MKALLRKNLFAAAIAVVVLPLALPAIAQTPDTIVVAQQADAYTLDPARHSVLQTGNILFQIFDSLVTLDDKGNYQPALAVSWSNPDPLTWRFKLREGVKFQDGEPFNAQAVKFTFDRALDPNFKSPEYAHISAIKSVEVVDDHTVDFKTAKPFPLMLDSVSDYSWSSMIVPPKYVAEKGQDILLTAPVGTGPYKFVKWLKDDQVELEANPDYWGGAPKISKVVFKPIKEERTRVAELASHSADIIVDVLPEDIKSVEAGGAKVAVVPSNGLYFFSFNTLDKSPLQDKRVRQAINYAVDVDAIQKGLMGGLGTRIALTLSTSSFAYDQNWKPYPYDPAKAKQLLAEAGYPNGFTLPIIARDGRHLKENEIVEATAGYLSQVGIKPEVKLLEAGVFAQISEKKGRKGMTFPGWTGADPQIVWYPLLHSGQYQSYYSNPDLDKLLDAGASTVDINERKAIYEKAGEIIKDEAPHLPLFQVPLVYGINAKLHWTPRMDGMIDLRKAYFE